MGEEFLLDIIALLNKQLSKKKIKEQLKGMDNSMFVKVISKLSISLSQRQLKKDLKQLNDLYIQVGADLKIDSALKKKLQGRIKTLQDGISDLQIEVHTKDSDIAKTVTEARNKGQRVASRTSIDFNIEVKKEKAIADLEYMAKKYSKLFSNASASSKYNNILDAAYGITDAKQLANVRAQIAAFTSELKANNLASQSLGDKWKRLIDRAKDLFSAASAVTLIFSQVKQAVSSFLQLDTAMTDLYKVQDQITSRDQFSGLLTKWNKLAQNLAVTTNSLISSMEAWSKIGFDLDMSEQLAEITSIFEKTAEISNEKATSTLISAAQAFTEIDDLGVDDYVKRVEAVGNKINAIGNKYAIDSEGISDGLQNASAALKVAGNDLNETIALITATNKIYQNPDEGSNMLKVASMRLRGQVDALKEMGEDAEGVSTDLTKIQQQIYELTGNKVNIFEDDESLKSTYQMILEIGEVFDSLNDRQQADLLEKMFGKQRASAGASLLLNYEELEKIKNDSINSANSMAEEYSKYMESASASLTIFKEKLIETYSTFMSGDLIKYTADMGSGLLDLVNATDLLRHGLVGIISLNIGKGITSIGASIASTVKQMNTLGNALQQVKNLPVDEGLRKESLQELGEATKNLTEKNLKLLLSQKQLEETDRIIILGAHDLTQEEAKLKLEKMGLLSATKQQTAANVAEAATTGTLKNAMLSLKATAKEVGATIKGMFANNPIGMGLMLATTAFSMLSTAVSKHNEKLEETRRANIESATTASENADKLKDLYNEYNRLASIQDRTTSEEESFKTAVENITVALGDKAEILKDLTAGTDEYADALARVTKEELQSQAVTATIGRKAAEEDLQGKIWSKWSGSQVTIDSNDAGKALSDEAQKAVDIVSESLKEFETVNRTWKNISWDISSDDPTEALEYYNSLIEAREKLVLASEDDESLLDTEIYEDLNTAINSMSESLDTYIEKLYEEEKLNYMAQNGIPQTAESYREMGSALVSVAGSSDDLQDRFKELLMADFSGLATDIGNVADAVNDVVAQTQSIAPTISSSIQQIATQLEPQFAKLGDAYKEIFQFDDNGKEIFSLDSIDNSMLEELRQAFADIKEEIGVTFDASKLDSFFDTLTNGNSIAEQVQQAFNDLATAYLYSTDTLDQLNSETANAIEKQLEELGVQNAAEIVADELTAKTEELIVAKEYLAQTGTELASATDNEVNAFILEQIEAGNCGEALALLQLKKMLVNGTLLDTSTDINNVLALAQAAGITSDALTRLASLKAAFDNAQASGNYGAMNAISAEMEKVKNQVETDIANFKPVEIQFDSSSAEKSAKKAGKKAGDAYVEAFEKEYGRLKDMLNRGEISEAQYLNALRRLYTRYFKDRKEYLDEYKKYESEYLSGMLDLHNKALSGISTLLGNKISAANDAKDAAISALEEEKEAAAEAYQAQIDAIEEEKDAIDDLIKEKDKKIDALNEEADAIQKAADTRKKNIDLQKEEADLERMLNQRTTAVYKEGKGFVFEADTTGIRDAREKVKEAKEELEIDRLQREADLIQKEIDLLEEKKDALTEEQEAIQKMLDESNKYYDNLIKQQEKMWDSMIKGMEQQKSKWEELADIQQIAEAYSAVQQVFGELGYSVEDVLNGSESAFEDFKSKYISLIHDVNNNSDFTDGLTYATGVAKENLGSFLDKTKETGEGIDELAAKGTELNTVAEGMGNLSSTASDANTNLAETATKTDEVAENVGIISEGLNQLPENGKVSGLAGEFETLATKIGEVAKALGIGEGEAVSTLFQAMNSLNDVTLGNEGEGIIGQFTLLKNAITDVIETIGSTEAQTVGSLMSAIAQLNSISLDESIIAQFTNLKTAIDSVTAAISGGGGGDSEGSAGGEGSDGKSGGGESGSKGSNGEGGGNSLTGAITSIGDTAKEVIGEPDAEGDGTVIGEFGAMETAVNDVTTAIGGGESESGNGQKKGEENSDNLIGSITNLGETTEEILGESDGNGIIGRFGEFKDVIAEANEQVTGISDGLAAIDGQTVECTIKINIDSDGFPSYAAGTALGAMNLESAEYNAKYEGNAHVTGTANVTGNWGVRKPGKSLVGEVGQEIWVHSADGTFETVGDNGPEWIKTEKGDLIFNHLQTKELLDKGNIVKTGKAYASGTIQYSDGTVIQPDGSVLRPLQPGDKMWDMYHAFDAYLKSIDGNLEKLVPNSFYEQNREWNKLADQITYANSVVNNRNVQQPVTIQIGDINLTGVQDVNGLAQAIKTRLPGQMMQEYFKN